MTGAGGDSAGVRDIIVQSKHGALKRISEFSSCYDPMHCVLLYPHGTNEWSIALKKALRGGAQNGGVTIMQYYRYVLGVRSDEKSLRPYAWGRLCQQFVADMYCKMESENLQYIQHNQRQIRAEVYQS